MILIITILLTACSSSGGSDTPTTYYNLTTSTQGQGEINPQAGEYKEDKEIELEAEPDAGWVFKNWAGINSSQNHYLLVMDADYTITAIFEEASLSGTVSVNNKTANSTTTITAQGGKVTAKLESRSVAQMNSLSANNQPEYKESELIIKYAGTINKETLKKFETKYNLTYLSELSTAKKIIHYKLPQEIEVKKAVDKYEQLPQVEYAEPNYIYHTATIPNDTYYQNDYQWAPLNLNLEAAWDVERGATKEINVAVIDTGIIPNHPDLQDRISTAGYDFVDGDSIPYDLVTPNDSYSTDWSHGTHVAGIIGAVGNNAKGIAGANWNLNIIPIRVLGPDGTGSDLDFAKGIRYAAGLSVQDGNGNEVNLNKEVDIINLSLGGVGSSTMKDALDEAVNKGILVFAAAGNGGSDKVGDDELLAPAIYQNTVAVGAVESNNERSEFSNYGPNLDLVAPGGSSSLGIYSTTGHYDGSSFETDYQAMRGTSMATPYVSGIASLLLAQGVEPSGVEARLKNTAVDLGPSGFDEEYGYGLVDAYGALLGKKLAAPKVFAATRSGDTLTVQSEVRQVADDETYGLNQIDEPEVLIVGWRDVNNDGKVNQGDYYGQLGPITVQDRGQSNDLQLNYIGPSTTDMPITVNGLN